MHRRKKRTNNLLNKIKLVIARTAPKRNVLKKEINHLKRTFLCLVLILLISSTAFAQSILTNTPNGQLYQNDDFKIKITYPNSWEMEERQSKPGFFILSAHSSTYFPIIGIISGPHQEVKPNKIAAPESRKNSKFEFKVEGQGETIIAGQKTKWVLSSFKDYEYAWLNTYTFMNFVRTDHHDYVITMQGNYNEYETDRKVFDEIISTLEIMP